MFTIQELNIILGVGHECTLNDIVVIHFHEAEDGTTEKITVRTKEWSHKFELAKVAYTAHLSANMSFRRVDLNALFRKLQQGYSNFNVVLPLRFTDKGFEVLDGPARGTKIFIQEGM
jgi:hypothetical protein